MKSELKKKMCETLIASGRVKEYDVIRHSYTNSRMSREGDVFGGGGLCPTLDTRCDCLGVVVKDD